MTRGHLELQELSATVNAGIGKRNRVACYRRRAVGHDKADFNVTCGETDDRKLRPFFGDERMKCKGRRHDAYWRGQADRPMFRTLSQWITTGKLDKTTSANSPSVRCKLCVDLSLQVAAAETPSLFFSALPRNSLERFAVGIEIGDQPILVSTPNAAYQASRPRRRVTSQELLPGVFNTGKPSDSCPFQILSIHVSVSILTGLGLRTVQILHRFTPLSPLPFCSRRPKKLANILVWYSARMHKT
ncbi:hypothetical protein BKA66DRAFT_320402 [Pyrenochaeta sp. MPI-SDFR-AT-0127]|nr:hypothetical protein BKA66DRAFT_320402 [Pyrenochaeta sp. MPI-SDFR-AT-0127]